MDIKPTDLINLVNNNPELTTKVYEDLVQPSVQNIGKAAGTITSTLDILLAPISWAIHGFEIINQKVKAGLEKKLADTPPENLTEPEANIVVPAYEALRYTLDKESLKEMYINLIAASMKKDTKDQIHPAFVEIIKQLSPLDALIFKEFCDNDINPIINLRIESEGTEQEKNVNIIKNITLLKNSDFYHSSVSVDNLIRLNLITINNSNYMDDKFFEPFYDLEIYKCYKKQLDELNITYLGIEKHILKITSIGKMFYDICVKDL